VRLAAILLSLRVTLHRRLSLFRQIAALIFIFVCTTIAWAILGATIFDRTQSSDSRLRDHVGSTWGTAQEQSPPTATYRVTSVVPDTRIENGSTITHNQTITTCVPLPLDSSQIGVNLRLDPRQKGLLWYSTYAVDFSGDYQFHNDSAEARTVTFRLPFPAQRAIYDGLVLTIDGQPALATTDSTGISGQSVMAPNASAAIHVAYRSQGLDSWRYKLADGVARVHNFALTMHTDFKDIDFADDTLSPSSKQPTANGWNLVWRYADLVSGFQISMTMPQKLQPGPLAGQISYFAPVSLFFFFFLMFIITNLRNIDLHPMNYFFLATAFFAFHLLLAYMVDHVSIHIAMAVSSLVSMLLVVSYLRLVVGIRFAALEAGVAQLIYLVVFSYAFFWKGFTGLSVTVISIITLFVVMQATGRIRWREKFAAVSGAPLPSPR
jgi:inner membrane protein involved in colicin E2 resistance